MLIGFGLFVPVLFGAQGKPAAETMIDILPPDLMVAFGASGWDQMEPAFNQSELGQLWHEQSVQMFYQQLKDSVWKKIETKMTQEGQKATFDAGLAFLKLAYTCPVAIGVGEKSSTQGPQIYGFLILSAGEKRTALAGAVTKLEATAKKGKIIEVNVGGNIMHRVKEEDDGAPPILWGWSGNYFVVVINDEAGMIAQYLNPVDRPMVKSVYLESLTKLPPMSEGKIFYVDLQTIGQVIKAKLEEESKTTTHPAGEVMRDLGLGDVKTLVARSGFSGPDIVAESLLTVPEPREGIFKYIRTVNLSAMDLVPADAIKAEVADVDLAGIYDLAMDTIKTVKPEIFLTVEKEIEEFEIKTQVKIRRDILGSLAGQMVSYSVPMTGIMGNPAMGGGVFMLKLKNSKDFEKSMTALEKYLAEKSEGKFQASEQKIDGLTFHFWMVPQLAMMQVAPAWTISKDQFVLATNMQLATAAVRYATTQNAQASSIRSTPGFKKVTEKLPENIIGFKYMDHKLQSRQTMQVLQQFWPMIAMILQEKGSLQVPMMLPPASDIVKHMGPEVGYSWYTADGIRRHDQGPFVETNASALVGASVGAAILLPSLGKARMSARETVSMSNLKQITLAGVMYAQDHKGKAPEELNQLQKYLGSSTVLESPSKPKDFEGPSYILVPILEIDSPPNTVFIYENPAFAGEKINVAFVDGRVERMDRDMFLSSLANTYKRLGKPMPEIKFSKAGKGWSLNNLFESDKPTTQATTVPTKEE